MGPLAGQYADLAQLLTTFPADVIVVDTMFFGAWPLALGPRADRPALACIGVMPYAASSRDTAPFGAAMQPGHGPIFRLRNRLLNVIAGHVVLGDINRLANRCLAESGAPRFKGSTMDLMPKVVDAYLQAGVAGFEYPRSDLPACVQFVGPILDPPSSHFDPPAWWGELNDARPVVHVTQGTLDNADPGRLLAADHAGPGRRRRSRRGHHRWTGSRTAAAAVCRPTSGWSGSSRTICCCPTSMSW